MIQNDASVGGQPMDGNAVSSEFDYLDPRPRDPFPFVRRLDFTPILEFWESLVRDEHGVDAASAADIRSRMEAVEGLLGPIDDLEIVWRNMPVVSRLMDVVIPPAFWDSSYIAAFVPFQYVSILATPRLKALMLSEQARTLDPFGLSSLTEEDKITLSGYLMVAAQFYDVRFDFDEPMITTILDPTTGLKRHYRLDGDNRFIRVKLVGELPPLDDAQILELRSNITDLDTWRRLIPAERFEFHGVGIVSAVDITDQEILSRMKHSLIDGDTSTTTERFLEIQQRVRELLRKPDIVILDDNGDLILDILQDHSKSDTEQIAGFAELHETSDVNGTIVDRALLAGRIQVIEDLTALRTPTAMERKVLARGLRSLLVAPLLYDRHMIGTVNLASPNASDLNSLSEFALREITPLFAMALRRAREEMNNRVQMIIRERYTAIHPAVEWRFRRAATRMMLDQERGLSPEVEQIVFDGVYPLYSVSDLRGSSQHRNAAIRADLQEHLRLALDVVRAAIASRPLPVFENISFRIEREMKRLDDGIDSGDESTILEFLRREIEPRFDHLGEMNNEIAGQVDRYRSALDAELGTVYRRRKEFEQSVAAINRMISEYLEEQQHEAQAMFPHYFEKHHTDGVDFGIYIGASLVEDGRFDLLYLTNLRLWQLQTMCGIAQRAAAMKPSLSVPLEMTHLILVQDHPLSIRFRLDEKQFDVDGAYNVRYEIMKKRIDKALIKGSSERLTQPETVAIVYSNAREAVEYGEHIEYLQSTGHLHPEVESLELEDLQEVQGLRALRVRVKTGEG